MAKLNLSNVQTGRPPRKPAAWPLSPQQERVLTHVETPAGGNLIVEARAGSGKTSTLVEVCKSVGPGAAFLAFNKAIATEIEHKLAKEEISKQAVKAATFHSVGFQAWVRHAPASAKNVRAEKLSILLDKIQAPRRYHAFARQAVSLAKQSLIGILSPIDDDQAWLDLVEHHDLLDNIPEGDFDLDEEEFLQEALAWSVRLLQQSIAEAPTLIDFDDMIYMPLYEDLKFWQYDWVLVDEAQDTNVARREISKRILRPNGRLIAVGDRHQAIYGFTGASHDALDLIERDFSCDILPLTVTYRCAKEIVHLAQLWVPDIEARTDAPPGSVEKMHFTEFSKIVPAPQDAILCRNTKPLVQLAFGFLKRHIPAHVEGREIGGALITLIKKFRGAITIGDLTAKLEDHLEGQRARLLAQYKEAQLGQLTDKIETILVLAETFDDSSPVYMLTELINDLFKDASGLARQTITLSTIHKAKGREWDTVWLLGRDSLMPSPYAKQDWQLDQERNLMYVAVTRARNRLVDVVLPTKAR